jgi:xylitol oxidase
MTDQASNWAGNITYRGDIRRPDSVDRLRSLVTCHDRVRALGTRHSFNDLADCPAGVLISTTGLPQIIEVDSAAATVRVTAGTRYAELAAEIDARGFALPNLGSLPHVSVGGACATATHGSGVHNGGLATSVRALELVTADGELVTISRDADGDQFNGAVVNLGALGVMVSLTLELVPSFDVRLRVFENLPLDAVDDHFTELMSSAYSVCLFTDWRKSEFTQVWINQRIDEPECAVLDTPWFTATPASGPRHPVSGIAPDSCTTQMGVPGRWYERLPHFRPEFTPSSGAELQSEYMVGHQDAAAALHALNRVREHIAPALQISEIRTIGKDELWMSPCYRRDSVSIHFTWIDDVNAVLPVAELVEEQLAPFEGIPHWAKIFAMSPEQVRSRYPRLPDFRKLVRHYDPGGKFLNPFVDRYLAPHD